MTSGTGTCQKPVSRSKNRKSPIGPKNQNPSDYHRKRIYQPVTFFSIQRFHFFASEGRIFEIGKKYFFPGWCEQKVNREVPMACYSGILKHVCAKCLASVA